MLREAIGIMNTFLQKKSFVVVAALMVVLAAAGCRQQNKSVPKRLQQTLNLRGHYVELSSIATFEWDRAYFFGPYTTCSTIERAVGCKWPDYEKCGIGRDDLYSVVIFLREKEIIAWSKLDRNMADYSRLYGHSGYAYNDVLFVEYVEGFPFLTKK